MRIQLAPKLVKKLKKQDVRLRKSFKKAIDLFTDNPDHPHLNNHELQRELKGYRSIDITSDWRGIYQEITEETEEPLAYFVDLGKHRELYKTN